MEGCNNSLYIPWHVIQLITIGRTIMRISLTLTALLTLIVAIPSLALPKFASRMGLACSSCHVNPTGGGMRNAFGAASYGREDLPIPTWQDEYGLDGFSTS